MRKRHLSHDQLAVLAQAIGLPTDCREYCHSIRTGTWCRNHAYRVG